jgi:hypothetical protein
MPLHRNDEPIRPWILERLDYSIRGPRSRDQVRAERFNRLMMMTIDDAGVNARDAR